MAPIDDSSNWQKVQDALERHLLAQSNGEPLDLLTACEGDHALAAKVREVLDGGQQLLDGTLLEAAPEPIRQSFGDFDLLRPLGRGGMGTVYLARQRSLGRLVALKRIEHAALEQPATRLRMQREAELTAAFTRSEEEGSLLPAAR